MVTQHLAHFNLARLRWDWDDPRVAPFVDAIGRVNALAARSPGFVWRMPDEEMPEGARPALFGGDARMAATLSVWEGAAPLRHFVHATLHGRFLGRRAEWFEPSQGPAYVLWPVAAGERPTLAEAAARLDRLAARGPSAAAHDFAYLDRAEARAEERQ